MAYNQNYQQQQQQYGQQGQHNPYGDMNQNQGIGTPPHVGTPPHARPAAAPAYADWDAGAAQIKNEDVRSKGTFGKQSLLGDLDFEIQASGSSSDGTSPENFRRMKLLIRFLYFAFVAMSLIVTFGHSYTFRPPTDRWLKIFAKYELFLVFAAFIQATSLWLLAVKSYCYESVDGIAMPTVWAFLIALGSRLAITFTNEDYDPEDGTWDFMMVQCCEALAVMSCIFIIMQARRFPMTETAHGNTIGGVQISFVMRCVAVMAALFFHRHRPDGYRLIDILWMFSVWEEALAMAPQLLLVMRRGKVEFSISHFMFMSILARLFHGVFWVQCFLAYGEMSIFAFGTLLNIALQWTMCGHFFFTFIKMLLGGNTWEDVKQNFIEFGRSL